MDSESRYFATRANFHRRMTRRAACPEARCAHEAFVRAYLARIEEDQPAGRTAGSGIMPDRAEPHRPVLSLATAE